MNTIYPNMIDISKIGSFVDLEYNQQQQFLSQELSSFALWALWRHRGVHETWRYVEHDWLRLLCDLPYSLTRTPTRLSSRSSTRSSTRSTTRSTTLIDYPFLTHIFLVYI